MISEGSIYHLLSLNNESDLIIRVLWVSQDKQTIVVVDATDSQKIDLPFFMSATELLNDVHDNKAKKMDYDPDERITNPTSEYLKNHQGKRDKKWEYIKEIVQLEPEIYDSKKRWQIIKDVKTKFEVKENVIYDAIKKYWFYGKNINGLINNYFDSGAKGKPKEYKTKPGKKTDNNYQLSDDDFKIFQRAVDEALIKNKKTLTDTHQYMLENYYKKNGYRERGVVVPNIIENESPTLRQFTYWYRKKFTYQERKSHKIGRRNAEKKYRALLSSTTSFIEGPGVLYQIDSTLSDTEVVAINGRTPIGRPTTFIVKDVFARKIVGYASIVNPPSWVEGAMMALENASTNKVEFCKKYNVTITEEEWPAQNLPRYIVADRGEMKSKYPNGIVHLGVQIANTPSYRPDLKAVIEQQFNITNKIIRSILYKAGAINKTREPGDSKPEETAAITMDTFNRIMIEHILAFNKSSLPREFIVTPEMFKAGVELTPLSIWNWGKDKLLLHERPKHVIHYALLPKTEAKVTRFGIEYEKLCYASKIGEENGWFTEN